MKRLCKALAFAALLLFVFPSSVFSGPPDRWDAQIQRPAAHDVDIWRGETIDLRPRFLSYSVPRQIPADAIVTLYWSTNRFATAPWGTNGVRLATETGRVSVTWSPDCDAGATSYSYFIGVSEPSGLIYRASGVIHMRTSPGFVPSTAPMPVWDGWTNNYVYATYAALLAYSNYVTTLVASGTGGTGTSDAVARASAALALDAALAASNSAASAQSAIGASGTLWRAEWLASAASLTNALTNTVNAIGIANGWSTNSAWTWQGAQISILPTNCYTITYAGPARWSSSRHELLPYSLTNYGAIVGSATITTKSNIALVDLTGTWIVQRSTGHIGGVPIKYSAVFATATSAVLSAYCSSNAYDAAADYYAYFTNLIVYSYDRINMSIGQYTNDAAGIVARVDPLPSGNNDIRRVVNAASLDLAIEAAKPAIAKAAWGYTPAGAVQPFASSCTLDRPLVQSGEIAFLSAGNYYCASYQGADWYSSPTGSLWRIGPSGRNACEIGATNRMLFVSDFDVDGDWATITVATNNVVGAPYAEFSSSTDNPIWLSVPSQIVSNKTTYWQIQCSATASSRYFRVVSPGGQDYIKSYYEHRFAAGISDGTTLMSSRSIWVVTNHTTGAGCHITGFFSIMP